MSDEMLVCHLGQVEYTAGVELQNALRTRVQAGELGDVLLLLEHPRVYTRGRRADLTELPLGEAFYRAQGIAVVETDRGGKVTYHCPGQLVGYPIMRIGDVHGYLRTMEEAIASALAQSGVRGGQREGLTGVWVDDRKIGSIGVHVSRRVTTHGFAINVDCDLDPFSWVVPCGLAGVQMTSLQVELERADPTPTPTEDPMACFRRRMALAYTTAHGRRQRIVTPERLGIADAVADATPSISLPSRVDAYVAARALAAQPTVQSA